MKREHIDDVQTSTVVEHFDLLIKAENQLDTEIGDVTCDDLPDWYDEKLFKKAQNYFDRNRYSIILAHLTGLVTILAVPDILKVILFTKQSHTSCMAFKRYSRTILYTYQLYTADLSDPDSLFYKVLNVIRSTHKMNTKRLQNHGIGGIYQKDMALTQFGFIGHVFTTPKTFGLLSTPEEEEAFNHFWRVIGYLIGISDRINICRKNVTETRELCQMMSNTFASYLHAAPENFDQLITNLINGLWHSNVLLNKGTMMTLAYKTIGIEDEIPLGWYDWLNMKYHNLIFYLLTVRYIGPVVRICYNYIVTFFLWMTEKCPVLAWISYGKKNAEVMLHPRRI